MIPTTKIILGIPLVFFIPGYVSFTALFLRGTRNWKSSFVETLFIQVILSILLSSITAFVLAIFGVFSLLFLCGILAIYSVLMAVVFRDKLFVFRHQFSSFTVHDAFLAVVIVFAAFLFFQPFEYLRGGRDQGTYMNAGINISRTGSVVIRDNFFGSLSIEDQQVFSHKRNSIWQRFPGFVTVDPDEGKIALAFYHLYPVWIAIFYSLFGLHGAFYVNAALGLISIVGVYMLGKALFHKTAGLIGAFLLAINIAQVWFTRFPTTEILAQLLLIAAIYTLVLFVRGKSGLFGTASALFLGSAFLARIDIILAVPVTVLYFYVRSFNQRRARDLFFIVPFLFCGAGVAFYYLTAARTPTMVICSLFGTVNGTIVFGLFVALLLFGLAWIFSSRISHFLKGPAQSKLLRIFLVAVILALAVFAYFIRPDISEDENAANLVELGWFLSPVGLFVALFGLLWLIMFDIDEKTVPFAGIFLSFAVFFVYRKLIFPEYMWAIRRFLPIVIPGACILTGYIIWRISGFRNRLAYAVSLLLLGSVTAHSILEGHHLVIHREYAGFADFCGRVSEQFDKDDVVVCDDYWLAEPMYFAFGVNTLSVSDQHDPGAMRKCARAVELMGQWISEGKDVFFVTHRYPGFVREFDFEAVAEMSYETIVLDKAKKQIPGNFSKFSPTVRIFRAVPIGDGCAGDGKEYSIDIGYNSFGLLEGFYGRERFRHGDQKFDYRWTSAEAKVVIPLFGDEKETDLVLRMSNGRPSHYPQAEVRIYIDEKLVKTILLRGFFEEHTIRIPAGTIGTRLPNRAILLIVSDTWNPHNAGVSNDTRELGVQIDWIRIENQKGIREDENPEYGIRIMLECPMIRGS